MCVYVMLPNDIETVQPFAPLCLYTWSIQAQVPCSAGYLFPLRLLFYDCLFPPLWVSWCTTGGGMPWLVHLGSLQVLSGTTFHKFYKPTKMYESCPLWTLASPIQSQGKSNNAHSWPYWRLTAHTYSHNIPQTYLIAVTNMAWCLQAFCS